MNWENYLTNVKTASRLRAEGGSERRVENFHPASNRLRFSSIVSLILVLVRDILWRWGFAWKAIKNVIIGTK
jgi:hypothetical protein